MYILTSFLSEVVMYDLIDKHILSACRQGRHPFYQQEVYQEAKLLSKATGRNPTRIIDGRLTALRRRGVIVFARPAPKQNKRWMIVEN